MKESLQQTAASIRTDRPLKNSVWYICRMTHTVTAVLFLFVGLHMHAAGTAPENDGFEYYVPKRDFYLSGGFFLADLNRLNATLPANASRMKSEMPAIGLGFATVSEKFTFNTHLSFAIRQRSIFSDYEQVFLGRTHWSFTFGRHLYANDKLTFVITPLLGLAYDTYKLNYHNDSFSKPASMNWIVRPQNPLGNDEGELDEYNNPSLAILAQLRVMKSIQGRFNISALVSYQHDLSSGKWHYDYGFRRMNSPDTYTHGLSLKLCLGISITESEW